MNRSFSALVFASKSFARKTDTAPDSTALFLLEGFQILAQIPNALAHGTFIIVFEILKNRAPHWHFLRSMRVETWPKTDSALDVLKREFTTAALCESCEIRHARVERRSGRAVAFGVGAVAGTAIQFEYGFPRGHIGRRKLRFVVTPILLSPSSESKQQETERNKAAHGHGLVLHDETYDRPRA